MGFKWGFEEQVCFLKMRRSESNTKDRRQRGRGKISLGHNKCLQQKTLERKKWNINLGKRFEGAESRQDQGWENI